MFPSAVPVLYCVTRVSIVHIRMFKVQAGNCQPIRRLLSVWADLTVFFFRHLDQKEEGDWLIKVSVTVTDKSTPCRHKEGRMILFLKIC